MNTPEAIKIIRVLAGEHYFARNDASTDTEAILFQVIRHMAHSDFSSALNKLAIALIAVMVGDYYYRVNRNVQIDYITDVGMTNDYSISFASHLRDQTGSEFSINGIISIENGLTITSEDESVPSEGPYA